MKRLLPEKSLILFSSLFLLILSALIISINFFPRSEKKFQNPVGSCTDFECSSQFFLNEQISIEKRIAKEDASSLYHEILNKYENSSPNNQHTIAHIFGEVLYQIKGPAGITVCGNSFAFGCFHGFFTTAIPDQGIGIVNELDQMCNEKFGEFNLGFQHGLGHGIAEYYGSKNLDKSLETCAGLAWKHRLMGCSGGVFMEYIMPSLSGNTPGSVKINPLNPTSPYHPCTEIKEYFQPECYYNLGNYFYHATKKNPQQSLELCEKVKNPLNKKSCLLGLGNSIFSNTRDIQKTISECKQAPSIDSEINCRSGAAWLLYTDLSVRNRADKFCLELTESHYTECHDGVNLLQIALNL